MSASQSRSGDAGLPASRYDLVLALIPLLLSAGTVASLAGGWPVRTGVAVGSILATVPVGYALFGEPPRPGRGRGRSRGPGSADV